MSHGDVMLIVGALDRINQTLGFGLGTITAYLLVKVVGWVK